MGTSRRAGASGPCWARRTKWGRGAPGPAGTIAATKLVLGAHASSPPNAPVGTAVTGFASCPASYVLLGSGARVAAFVADPNVALIRSPWWQ